MAKRRVVVTGLGMVSPLGLSVKDTWSNILSGKSGVTTIEHFDTTNFSTRICGKVGGFVSSNYFAHKDIKKVDIFTQYGIAASDEALRDSGLTISEENATSIGVAVGSGIGGITTLTENHAQLLKHGPRRVSPFFVPAGIINMVAGQISLRYGLKGPNLSIVTACTTGAHNIGIAGRTIAYGDADIMLAGGAEMANIPLCIAGFIATRALSKRNDEPEKASRPWDKDRDGFVLAEGAGVLILEEYEHAIKRNANIYAELAGFGMSADATHMTLPDLTGDGFMRTMQNAINDAGIAKEKIDYINAHGTSTPTGDAVEAKAIKQVFGSHANQLAVSSTKSMTGHLLGAAGAVESIFSILALRDQVAPPTINLDNPSPDCDLNFVAHKAQERKIDFVLNNSFGFGGTNGALIFKKV